MALISAEVINEAIRAAVEDRIEKKVEDIVRNDVIYCVSSLIYELRSVSDQLDDYDAYLTLTGGKPDYEDAVASFIKDDADLEQLEWIADNDGYWEDVQREAGYDPDNPPTDKNEYEASLEDWLREDATRWEDLRLAVWKIVSSYEEVANEYNLEPDYMEIYEHWIVSDWLGQNLCEQGHVVEEYLGLTIWGRPTTGQSISMDGVMHTIAYNLLKEYPNA